MAFKRLVFICMIFFPTLAIADIYDSSLVAWWRMDQQDFNLKQIYDKAKVNYDTATFYGATPGVNVGQVSQSLYLDQTSNCISSGTNTGFNTISSVTIAVWALCQSPTAKADCVLGSGSSGLRNFQFCLPNAYSSHTGFEWYGVGTGERYSPNITFSSGTWHHYAATYGAGVLCFYKDGVQVDNYAIGGYLYTPAGGTFHIGDEFYASYFKGYLDDIRIYSRALSQKEIYQIWHQGQGSKLWGIN